MNRAQVKYALERIDRIEQSKISAARRDLIAGAKKLSDEERYTLVASRKVKLKETVNSIDSYTRVVHVFDFSKYETADGFDAAAFAKVESAIKAEANCIRDKLVLGNAEEALALIQAFSATAGA